MDQLDQQILRPVYLHYTQLLHLFRYVSDDGFRARLKDQLPLDEGRHRVRSGGGFLLVCFHGYLGGIVVVLATCGVLRMAGMLGEDSEGFLQFDLLPV